MTDEMPPESSFMPLAAIEKQQRALKTRRHQSENLVRLGPRALGPGDGFVEPTAWVGDVEGRRWVVDGLIPAAQVTMINGNGGEGKSLLALQMAVGAATGIPWLGNQVKGVNTVYVHCEDDEMEMRRRIGAILTPRGKTSADLDGLTLIDRDGAENSLLYEAHGNDSTGRFTPFYDQLYETVRTVGAELLFLDSLYNFFGGNENIRSQVTEFVGGLKRLSKQLNCSTVVIAHPGRAGMGEGGDGTSGSTAWNNAVRSRFYLHRKKHHSGDPDKKGPLMWKNMKSNYGPPAEPIEIVWDNGQFVPAVVGEAQPMVKSAAQRKRESAAKTTPEAGLI